VTEYAGESLAKKVARVRLYTRVKETLLFSKKNLDDTKVLFLPGPDACEVGALKHILKVKPENVVGIDLDGGACEALHDKWPDANIVKGNLLNTKTFCAMVDDMATSAKDMHGFDFIHLDLMGGLNIHSEYLYGNYGRLCVENGVMAVTYLRGREHPTKVSLRVKQTREMAKEVISRMPRTGENKLLLKMLAPDPERAMSHLIALNSGHNMVQYIEETGSAEEAADAMSDEVDLFCEAAEELGLRDAVEMHRILYGDRLQFTLLASYAYRAETSPMGVMAAHRITYDTLESESYALLRYKHGRHTSSVIKKDPMDDLLKEAELLAVNYGKEEAAEILNVSTGTLAAWRAHQTRGTYAA